MDIHGFATGVVLANVDGVAVRDNTLSNIGNDGLIAGDISDAVCSRNVIDLKTPEGKRHAECSSGTTRRTHRATTSPSKST